MWRVDAPAASQLLASGAGLQHLRVIVDAPGAAAADLAAELAARGADAGLAADASSAVPDPVPAAVVLRGATHDDALAFRVKSAASDLRARRADVRVGLEAPGWEATGELAAYLDFVVLADGAPTAPLETWRSRVSRADSLTAALAASERGTVLLDWPGPAVPLAAAALVGVLGDAPLPEPVPLVTCREVSCRVRAFLRPDTGARLVWIEADAPVVHVAGLAAREAIALSGGALAVAAAEDGTRLDPPSRSFVLRLADPEDVRFASDVTVADARLLSAEEVLARHRAADQRRRLAVRRSIATGSTTVTFTLPGLSAPSVVTAAVETYDDGGRREVVHRDLRWNGTLVPIGRDRVPRLPIVEPAAAEPPLEIRLTEAYAYRLARPETVAGRRTYVLQFAPRAGEGPHGRAFVDTEDFGLVRLETVRTGLAPPIVSSEQKDVFTRTTVDGRAVWLPERSEIHQTYEGPGHRTPIHRVVRHDRVEVNPSDFAERRGRAHASADVMMGETPQGFRYLAADPAGGARRPAGTGGAVRTVALGVTVDPNVDGVLPFGGLGYVDLDAFARGAQVNAFAGPGFVQGALTLPRLGGGWQAHAAGFAALVRYNDRAFDEGVEDYGRTVRQRPARLSLGASRSLAARVRLRLSYELEHNALARSELAAQDFVTPASPLAHGVRAEVELRRGPWTANASGSAHRRSRWEPWGRGTDELPAGRATGYQRYGLAVSRSLVLGPRATGRLEAAWMDGRDLDRFSRYAVDSFLNRLRGYPAGSLRYDRGLLLRAQASAALRPGLRADLFADTGFLHDPGYGRGLKSYPGTALGLELALPRGTLLTAEAGIAFQGRDREGCRGTRSLQVTAVKTF